MDKLTTSNFKRGLPKLATCRGKLQNRRCKLNEEINKEILLRAGAENLYKATTNKKLRDTVALELSFVNSNLQLLKEQLSNLNSEIDIYQSENSLNAKLPMITLGLKETKEIIFHEQLSDFILEHYSEDPHMYETSISDLINIRQAATKYITRDEHGVKLLCKYYNLLYYVERRFFSASRNLHVYFEWFDSLTGNSSCQKSITFEKACILFNIGALYTQIGAKQDRNTIESLDIAIENFMQSASLFQFTQDTFVNPPTSHIDLNPNVLEIFVLLMKAQARECVLDKLQLTEISFKEMITEASLLTVEYEKIYEKIHQDIQCNSQYSFPECWLGIIPLKSEYFRALGHLYTAKSMTKSMEEENGTKKHLNLKLALNCHEEILRLQRMCRELRNKLKISKILEELEENILDEMNNEDIDIDDFDLSDITLPCSTSKHVLALKIPDFGKIINDLNDPFMKLGPIAVFSARRFWTAPRSIQLHRTKMDNNKSANHQYFGFTITSDSPVKVASVNINSLADLGGIKVGDYIVEICGCDAKWFTQHQINEKVTKAFPTLDLKVITMMNQNPQDSVSTTSDSGFSSGCDWSPSQNKNRKVGKNKFSSLTAAWNPFKSNKTTKRQGNLF